MLQAYRVASGKPTRDVSRTCTSISARRSRASRTSPTDALGESRWWLHGAGRGGRRTRPAVLEALSGRSPPARSAAEARASDALHRIRRPRPRRRRRARSVRAPTRRLADAAREAPPSVRSSHFLRARPRRRRHRSWRSRPRRLARSAAARLAAARSLRRAAAPLPRRRSAARRCRPITTGCSDTRPDDAARISRVEMPPPSAEVRDRETRLFLDDLALFVEAEARLDPSRTPVGFEVAFGRARRVDEEPLRQRDARRRSTSAAA